MWWKGSGKSVSKRGPWQGGKTGPPLLPGDEMFPSCASAIAGTMCHDVARTPALNMTDAVLCGLWASKTIGKTDLCRREFPALVFYSSNEK